MQMVGLEPSQLSGGEKEGRGMASDTIDIAAKFTVDGEPFG